MTNTDNQEQGPQAQEAVEYSEDRLSEIGAAYKEQANSAWARGDNNSEPPDYIPYLLFLCRAQHAQMKELASLLAILNGWLAQSTRHAYPHMLTWEIEMLRGYMKEALELSQQILGIPKL